MASNQQSPTSHLIGLTKYKRKRRSPPMSSSSGNNRGKAPRLVSYCPECPQTHAADPENHVHVTVTARTKKGSCKSGHVWDIV